MTPLEVVAGIETRLKTIQGLRVDPDVPAKINPPSAFVALPSIDYLGAMRGGLHTLTYEIVVMVSQTVTRVGQAALMEYAAATGDKSIKAAIEADRTLGLADTDAHVRTFQPFGIDQLGAYNFYGGTFGVLVHTKGTA